MKPRTTWLAFAMALAVVLGVMAWVTVQLLRLEDQQHQGQIRAEREERVRLALWRMDSSLTPLVAQESALAGLPPEGVALPRGVRARFVRDAAGRLTLWSAAGEDSSSELSLALGDIDRLALVPADGQWPAQPKTPPQVEEPTPARVDAVTQSYRNSLEWSQRATVVQDNISAYETALGRRRPGDALGDPRPAGEPVQARGQPVRPLWLGSQLVLVRRDAAGQGLEGSWLEWNTLQADLRARVVDLLPQAELVSAAADVELGADRHLATLPIRLVPGDPPRTLVAWGFMRISLVIGWVFVLLASTAVAALLRAALGLSERRAAFVSAVTHELRTPLTTFRMYTEMLEADMVPDKRARYLSTLRREAERLGHLVENVLTYARIESDRHRGTSSEVEVGMLVDRVRERLVERCAAAQVELRVQLSDAADAVARVDEAAAEQILFNLVDNAAKYGASESQAWVELAAGCGPRNTVELHVRDNGPGVPPAEARRIFQPFAKGSAHTTGTQPGVGLGLALSRQLARQMGGDLRLVAGDSGADFVLILPRA